MCDEVDRAFSKFSSYGSRARYEGSGDDKRILVSFFAQADLSSVTSGPCADLLDLIFVQYFPADMKGTLKRSPSGIPKNIKEADLTDIANQVSAKAINIPLSFTSYKLKPYVYMNFFSQETFDAAKELTVSFRNRGLTWHSPDQVKNLCHVCGRLAGPQQGRTSDHSQRSSSHSRSRSRSTHPNSHKAGRNNGP
ncbi:unnamed protein product [Rhizophagus irregularis]|nr:unnamed protein product [Rhizophagus irregularis]